MCRHNLVDKTEQQYLFQVDLCYSLQVQNNSKIWVGAKALVETSEGFNLQFYK